MGKRLSDLEAEVSELREAVDKLSLTVTRLRREVAEQRGRRSSESDRGEEDRLSDESYSVVGARQAHLSGSPGGLRGYPSSPPDCSQQKSGGPSTSALPAARDLSWAQREEIAAGIGRFFTRCLTGSHRGSSGRDKIPLACRLWVVVRDYHGQVHSPVRVFKTWTSCKGWVKQHEDVGDSIFCGFPSAREAKVAIAAAELQWPVNFDQ